MKPPVEESILQEPATVPPVVERPARMPGENRPKETPGATVGAPDPLRPGKMFAWFELQREIDAAITGVVWLAQDYSARRQAEQSALKFLPDSIVSDKTAAEELKNELRRRIALRHPNILRVYDLVEHKGRVAIQMEYVEGQSLSHLRLARPKQVLEIRDLEKWVTQLCEALEYAHKDVGLIDVEIVPGNLIVDRTGKLKLKDIGIANCITNSMCRLTANRDIGEMLQAKSPQRAAGEKPAMTDALYSLGATIYELLTSKPPFDAGDIAVQVTGKIPPSMIERRAELGIEGEAIPKSWEETVAACLAKDPLQRPRSAIEVGERLKDANSSSDISIRSAVESVPGSIARPEPPARTPFARNARLVAAGVGFILALGSAIGLFSLRHPRIGRHGYEPEMSIVSEKRGEQEPLQRVQFVPVNEPAHPPAVPLPPSGPNGKDSAQSTTVLSPEASPTPSSEISLTLFPPETATSYENQITGPSPGALSESDVDATTEDVVKRIKAVPGVSARRKADLIEKMHKARSMERLTVIPFDTGQIALRRGATDGLVKAFDRPGMRDKLSDPTVILVVAGYADIAGRADLNLHFSQERAENVSKILKEQAKLSNAMQTIGMGGTELLDSKRPESNRAVEIWAVVPL